MSINYKVTSKDAWNIPISDGELNYWPNLFDNQNCKAIFTELLELPWQQNRVRIFNNWYLTPRLESLHGEIETTYSYSGQILKTQVLTPLLFELKTLVEELTGHTFNVVLVNYYRNGEDSNGWHADNEPELGQNPVIASLSFGVERRFDLKHKFKGDQVQIHLKNGSLLLMSGPIQHFWKHQIAKSKKISEGRINLTFRRIVQL